MREPSDPPGCRHARGVTGSRVGLLDRLRAGLVDRYTIERELGRGGMAIVYLAEDVKHERKVALMVPRPELAASLGAERFLREIRTAAQLTHPNVLPLHDSGEADGTLYYTMPYVEGESLRDRLTREKQLPIEDALQITREVAVVSAIRRHYIVGWCRLAGNGVGGPIAWSGRRCSTSPSPGDRMRR
jgi:serine/threonine protein kinase